MFTHSLDYSSSVSFVVSVQNCKECTLYQNSYHRSLIWQLPIFQFWSGTQKLIPKNSILYIDKYIHICGKLQSAQNGCIHICQPSVNVFTILSKKQSDVLTVPLNCGCLKSFCKSRTISAAMRSPLKLQVQHIKLLTFMNIQFYHIKSVSQVQKQRQTGRFSKSINALKLLGFSLD
ncbi:Hypothetical_protein [Hexamita inflata]|uniref:Hypothetical_protein n=1 Tax=Hexamita inflata TaxID=28002 RepID=A0ABP1GDC0_9EUKA